MQERSHFPQLMQLSAPKITYFGAGGALPGTDLSGMWYLSNVISSTSHAVPRSTHHEPALHELIELGHSFDVPDELLYLLRVLPADLLELLLQQIVRGDQLQLGFAHLPGRLASRAPE